MEKLNYIHAGKINAKLSPFILSGYHIVVEGITYELISRTPIGKRLIRKLTSSDTKIKLYA